MTGDRDVIARTIDPDGRAVFLTRERWAHILAGHPELAAHRGVVMEAISRPDHRAPDVLATRERYLLRGVGPSRWVRVVVDFSGAEAVVVTAFAERRDPPGWQTSTR